MNKLIYAKQPDALSSLFSEMPSSSWRSAADDSICTSMLAGSSIDYKHKSETDDEVNFSVSHSALLNEAIRLTKANYIQSVWKPVSTVLDLTDRFEIRNPSLALQFLRNHHRLIHYLNKGAAFLSTILDSKARPVLELFIDDEEPEFIKLFVYIRTTKDVNAVVRHLEDFNFLWWLLQEPKLHQLLAFDVEWE